MLALALFASRDRLALAEFCLNQLVFGLDHESSPLLLQSILMEAVPVLEQLCQYAMSGADVATSHVMSGTDGAISMRGVRC
eukprot:3357136-Rhodomonas_salina.1